MRYNHAFTFAAEVISEKPWKELSEQEKADAIIRRCLHCLEEGKPLGCEWFDTDEETQEDA